MTDNKMTAEQALREYMQGVGCIYGINWQSGFLAGYTEAMFKCLSAPRVPVAWLVTRDRDKSFPRLYVEKAFAERVVSFVDVNPPAVLHPLYTLAASTEPVAQTIERDSGTLTVDADGGVSKIEPKRYKDAEAGLMNEIIGLESAVRTARALPHPHNIPVSAGMIIEVADRIADLRAEVEALRVENEALWALANNAGEVAGLDINHFDKDDHITECIKAYGDAIVAEVEALKALKADAERLDWMDKNVTRVSCSERYLSRHVYWGKGTNKDVRQAIDAARLRERGE